MRAVPVSALSCIRLIVLRPACAAVAMFGTAILSQAITSSVLMTASIAL
jgi:hypothetical protein